jgi:hypothetical protein
MKTAYWIVTGLFCLLMLAAAAVETFGFAESLKFVLALGYPAFIAYVLPITKIVGVVAILSNYSKTLKEWAYAGFFFDFVLAALSHYFSGVPSPVGAIVALVLLMTSYILYRKVYGGLTH